MSCRLHAWQYLLFSILCRDVLHPCIETGKTEGKHCSVCNEVIVAQKEISALGHDNDDWVITSEATCTETGSRYRICNVCDYIEEQTIAAKGHTYSGWITTKEATTTQNGEEQRECSSCNKIETKVTVYETPKTGDIIMLYVFGLIIGTFGIFVTTKILKQKSKKS